MNASIYNVGVVGCGRVAWLLDQDPLIPDKPVTHMGAYLKVDRTRVIAAADTRIDRLAAFSKEFGIENITWTTRICLPKRGSLS